MPSLLALLSAAKSPGIVQIVARAILIRLYISCGSSGHTSKVSEKLNAKLTQRYKTMNRWNKSVSFMYTHTFFYFIQPFEWVEKMFQWKIDSESEKLKLMFSKTEKKKIKTPFSVDQNSNGLSSILKTKRSAICILHSCSDIFKAPGLV